MFFPYPSACWLPWERAESTVVTEGDTLVMVHMESLGPYNLTFFCLVCNIFNFSPIPFSSSLFLSYRIRVMKMATEINQFHLWNHIMVLSTHASLPRLAQADGCRVSSLVRKRALSRDEVQCGRNVVGAKKLCVWLFGLAKAVLHFRLTLPSEQRALGELEAAGFGEKMAWKESEALWVLNYLSSSCGSEL